MSAFTKGNQVSNDAFEAFEVGELVPGSVASGTGDGVVTTLGFTPDFVLFEVGATPNALSWTATSTSLTMVGRSTTTAATISYIAGNLT